jgi:hypothetical protein
MQTRTLKEKMEKLKTEISEMRADGMVIGGFRIWQWYNYHSILQYDRFRLLRVVLDGAHLCEGGHVWFTVYILSAASRYANSDQVTHGGMYMMATEKFVHVSLTLGPICQS